MILMESAAAETALSPFFAWMMDMLRAIAGMRSPFLDGVFSVVTKLGEETVFLVVLMIVIWCVNKKFGYRFLAMFLVGTFLHLLLKGIFAVPRPWEIDPGFQPVESAIAAASGYSFPSGHTLTACLVCFGLAQLSKKKWAYAIAAVLTVLVGFSRLYLGVHTILDVGVGLALGLLIFFAFVLIFRKHEDSNRVLNTVLIVSTALCIGLLVYIILKKDADENALEGLKSAATLVGSAVGMLLAKILDDTVVRFDVRCAWWKQCLKILLGFAIVLGIRFGLKALFGGSNEPVALSGVRYFAMAFVGGGLYPMLFRPLFKAETKE